MKKTIFKVIDLVGTLIIAIPALILGGIIGICLESFQQGYSDGKNRVN